MLALLRPEKSLENSFNPPVQKELAACLKNVVTNNLSRKKINTPPKNCLLLLALNLNPIVAAAIAVSIKRRDTRITGKEKQIGPNLWGKGIILSALLEEENQGQSYLQWLFKPKRCQWAFARTMSRRALISINLKTDLIKDNLKQCSFGWVVVWQWSRRTG